MIGYRKVNDPPVYSPKLIIYHGALALLLPEEHRLDLIRSTIEELKKLKTDKELEYDEKRSKTTDMLSFTVPSSDVFERMKRFSVCGVLLCGSGDYDLWFEFAEHVGVNPLEVFWFLFLTVSVFLGKSIEINSDGSLVFRVVNKPPKIRENVLSLVVEKLLDIADAYSLEQFRRLLGWEIGHFLRFLFWSADRIPGGLVDFLERLKEAVDAKYFVDFVWLVLRAPLDGVSGLGLLDGIVELDVSRFSYWWLAEVLPYLAPVPPDAERVDEFLLDVLTSSDVSKDFWVSAALGFLRRGVMEGKPNFYFRLLVSIARNVGRLDDLKSVLEKKKFPIREELLSLLEDEEQ